MRHVHKFLASLLAVVLALSSSAAAQDRHVVDPGALAATLADSASKQDADRLAIHEALDRPQVREMASHMGLDLERVNASIDTLTGPDLERAAAAARQTNESLVGGASALVLSTTTIIIILLIVILLIVAIK